MTIGTEIELERDRELCAENVHITKEMENKQVLEKVFSLSFRPVTESEKVEDEKRRKRNGEYKQIKEEINVINLNCDYFKKKIIMTRCRSHYVH